MKPFEFFIPGCAVAIVLLVAASVYYSLDQATAQETPPPPVARFKLVTATNQHGRDVFKIDTVTGQVWRRAEVQVEGKWVSQWVELK